MTADCQSPVAADVRAVGATAGVVTLEPVAVTPSFAVTVIWEKGVVAVGAQVEA